jgi:hypothetical protein
MDSRGSRQAASGRARGVIVGSLIALGWWIYGSAIFTPVIRAAVNATALVLTVSLVVSAARTLRHVRSMPVGSPAGVTANRRAWRWFWLNLVGEIVLLNVAVSLLSAPELRVYWIAAISGVVGLHFLPMAVFFRTRSYWFVGIAMMTGAVVAALLIARHAAWADAIARIEALANAVILWSSLSLAAVGHRSADRRPAGLDAGGTQD